MNILLVEDEEELIELVTQQLTLEGYSIFKASDGLEALKIFENTKIDLIICDVMMPKLDGFGVMRKVREKSNIPFIFLTAKGEEIDRVLGLTLGADDYMVKPFSIAELKARIGVQLRRLKWNDGIEIKKIKSGELILNIEEGVVYKRNEQISLNAKEYLIIKYLMENKKKILTKKQIYYAVWNDEYMYEDNTIMVHISHIRNKIEDDPKNPQYLVTVRGLGYKFLDPK